MIRVQENDFDTGAELKNLVGRNYKVGGLCSFVGLVRDFAGSDTVGGMTLEHYPAMTEKELQKIDAEANKRWPLEASLIIHRYGRLEPGDQIVLVATASAHRQDAFDSCQFLIDWLKTQAPFWKLEETNAGSQWVAARDSDYQRAQRWEKK
ncbi:MAG: molybdenum cofactor biosynthesis protein MoaE [Rhodospirillaceae bacterium]|jgi:molybdopterin synthase catalytic subunit